MTRTKEHYDVGILGVWPGCNYGSVATYYALNRVITSMGKTVLMIDKPFLKDDDVELKQTHARVFAESHYNISKRYKIDQMHLLNRLCDDFVIGSDQVWNYGISKNFGKLFYLNFAGEKKRKIAYGVSLGHGIDFSPVDERIIIADYMKYFDKIGVREDDGVELLKKCYGINSDHVIDPVFLADPAIYDELINESSEKETEPYILTYILDPTPEKREAILHLQKRFNGIKVINILDGIPWLFDENKKKMEMPNCLEGVRVQEWLSYIKSAKFFLTDSCHGASFAMIFQKDFIAIANRRRGYSRFYSLTHLFGVEDRLVTDPKEIIENENLIKPIHYEVVNKKMSLERERCYKWLFEALNNKKTDVNELLKKNVIGPVKMTNPRAIAKPQDESLSDFNVSVVTNEKKCNGCGVCYNVCPHKAITFEKNMEGFINPVVDRNKCVNCGICIKKCTSKNPSYKNNPLPKTYAMMASDEIRKISSSGGMFTVAAEYILNNGGYVAGAAYKKDFSVEHILIDNANDLCKLRGSKYMQSDAQIVYPEVKKLLRSDKTVLFTGMPCQVAGLYSYLGKDYERLFTMDLLCHGITSSKVFEKYHKDVLKDKPLARLEFKEKEPWGWHAGVNAYFADGTKYSEPLETDTYFIAYLKSIAKNTTCAICPQNRLPRQGDLTIGDFWGIIRHDPEMYDKKGTSVVLVNNEKGQCFFDALTPSMKKYKEESLDAAIAGNHIIERPYGLNKNRDVFFDYFDKLDFASLTLGCFKNKLYKKFRNNMEQNILFAELGYYHLAQTTVEKAHGREIVTWIRSEVFERILKEFFGKEVSFRIAADPNKVNNDTIFPISKIKGNRSKYYIVALDPPHPEETYKTLVDCGFDELEDFISRIHKPIVLENYDCKSKNYFDAYGNTIEGYPGVIGRVVFRGCNNHIVIGDNVKGMQNLFFDLSSNSYIEIGDGCRFNDKNSFRVLGQNGGSEIIIDNNCRLTNALYRCYNSPHISSIIIGDSCTFETNLELHANSGKKIHIGRDCLFSHDIDLWAGDGHSIFDVNTGQNTNSVFETCPSYRNELYIGNHVWVSKGAFIMHGTHIEDGSIVGAKSVVKGRYPNNCVIAGNPSAVVKKDIAWSRDMVTNDISRCGGIEYAQRTKSDQYAQTSSGNKNSRRSVLILGGTGRMSKRLTQKCLDNGDDVTISVRGRHKISDEISSRVKIITLNRDDLDGIKKVLKDKFYDVIFDCSGFAPQYVEAVLDVVQTNRYIYVSSFDTYAHYNPGRNRKESDLPLPGKSYKASIKVQGMINYPAGKYHSELLIANKYQDLNYAIVRIPFVMSKEDDGFNDVSSGRIGKYVDAILNEKPINSNHLDHRFSFVESNDEAAFLLFLSKSDFKGVVNFASEGDISMRELIDYLEKETGKTAILSADVPLFPFSRHAEVTLNLDTCRSLKYQPLKLEDWFFDKDGEEGLVGKFIRHYKK